MNYCRSKIRNAIDSTEYEPENCHNPTYPAKITSITVKMSRILSKPADTYIRIFALNSYPYSLNLCYDHIPAANCG